MADLAHGLRRLKWHGMRVLGREFRPQPALDLPTERLGSDYGGWTLWPAPLGPESRVWSFGLGADVTFDQAVVGRFGVTVHGFDPTPEAEAHVRATRMPARFRYHAYGVADRDGMASFRPLFRNAARVRWSHDYALTPEPAGDRGRLLLPVRRLATIREELGSVDLIKMDVEGAEYPVLRDFLRDPFPCGQLLIEFHHFHDGALDRTERAIRDLAAAGWRLYHVSETGRELSFAHDDALESARRVPPAARVTAAPREE